jgi:hypothetical protein
MLIEKQGFLSLESFMPADCTEQWEAAHFMNKLNTKKAQRNLPK